MHRDEAPEKKLIGMWKDKKAADANCSLYILTRSISTKCCIDVCTYRPNGKIQKTAALIRYYQGVWRWGTKFNLEWCGNGTIRWVNNNKGTLSDWTWERQKSSSYSLAACPSRGIWEEQITKLQHQLTQMSLDVPTMTVPDQIVELIADRTPTKLAPTQVSDKPTCSQPPIKPAPAQPPSRAPPAPAQPSSKPAPAWPPSKLPSSPTQPPVKPAPAQPPGKSGFTQPPVKPAPAQPPVKSALTQAPGKPAPAQPPVKPAPAQPPVKPAPAQPPVKPALTQAPGKPAPAQPPVTPALAKSPVKPAPVQPPIEPGATQPYVKQLHKISRSYAKACLSAIYEIRTPLEASFATQVQSESVSDRFYVSGNPPPPPPKTGREHPPPPPPKPAGGCTLVFAPHESGEMK